jgi:NAD(P)-dependent dehydrogenase (short-subunit alcohol dehydrogenase family)
MDMTGKTALVTGTASGLGRETALTIARHGAKQIACLDIHDEGNAETAESLRRLGAEPLTLRVDLGDVGQIRAAFAETLVAFGRIDAAALIGGYSWKAETLDVTPEQWDKFVNVNLRGAFFCCQEALRAMYERGSGAIVTMSADAAFYPMEGLAVQAAAKGGVAQMSKAFALEAARHGVRVNAISPGIVHVRKSGWVTPAGPPQRPIPNLPPAPPAAQMHEQTARGKWLLEREIADAVVFLCSDAASGVSGDTLFVNGGGYFSLRYDMPDNLK